MKDCFSKRDAIVLFVLITSSTNHRKNCYSMHDRTKLKKRRKRKKSAYRLKRKWGDRWDLLSL
jgi:DNA-binding transcriptional regulator PaaX